MTITRIAAPSSDYQLYEFYKVSGPLTMQDVQKLNATQKRIVLVLESTKGQNTEVLKYIQNPRIKFSVLGGIDYTKKQKFNSTNYIERTMYDPETLCSVIKVFESIEQKIRYAWTDRQKCMFVYKTLAEHLHYKYDHEFDYEMGRDVVRRLDGLLYKKLVCSGFALVFKEAMDRLDIPCEYQNRQGHHSWDIVELDGKKYGIELTWDCYNKGQDNRCGFVYFGRDASFYQNKHHDISKELEEVPYPLSSFTKDELAKDLSVISHGKGVEIRQMRPVIGSNSMFCYPVQALNGITTYMIYENGSFSLIHTSKSYDEMTVDVIQKAIRNNGYDFPSNKIPDMKYQEYRRKDNSHFYVTHGRELDDQDMGEYYYFDVVIRDNVPCMRRGVLLSEMDLAYSWDNETKNKIANYLLDHDRLRRKINTNHGYVGYLQQNQMYYNRSFEEEKLHVANHV